MHKHIAWTIFEYTVTGQLAVMKIFGCEVYRRIGSQKNYLGLWRT